MPEIPGAPVPHEHHGKDGADGEGTRGMTGTRGEKGNERSHGNNGAPGIKGFKKDKCNVGCSRGRFFRNSLRWPIYIINSVYKTKLSCNTPY